MWRNPVIHDGEFAWAEIESRCVYIEITIIQAFAIRPQVKDCRRMRYSVTRIATKMQKTFEIYNQIHGDA